MTTDISRRVPHQARKSLEAEMNLYTMLVMGLVLFTAAAQGRFALRQRGPAGEWT
jgi:hypothetical protein